MRQGGQTIGRMGQEVTLAGEIASTQAVAAAPPAQVFRAQAATVGATRAEDAAVAVTNGPPSVNPGLHLDVALNLVVLQFFNAQGDVTQSIPSQKQLEAYAQDGSDPSQTVSKLL
jgi:hypothetical protein